MTRLVVASATALVGLGMLSRQPRGSAASDEWRSYGRDYTNQRFIRSVTYNAPMPDSLFTATPTYDPYVLERKLDSQENPKR